MHKNFYNKRCVSVLSAGHGFPTPLGVTTTIWLFDIFPLTQDEYSSSHWTTQLTQSVDLSFFKKTKGRCRILTFNKISY